MKKIFTLSLLFIAAVSLLCGATIVNDDIQSWTNRGSYGSYTQTITVGAGTGTVNMTACIVANGAAATGTCSLGRVQMQASTGILELPALPSVGRAEFHFAAGAAGRTIALQSYNGSTWDAVTSFTGIGTTGATYYYDLNSAGSTTLRLASPSAAIYLHDIIITDNSGSSPTLAVLSTAVASSITSTTAISGGTITSDGGATVTARGVCWNTSANPTISNSVTTDGTGAGSYVSNISSLIAETQYYYRAYATNSQGTAYGEEYSFSTSGNSPPPAPVATAASSVGINSFTANWNAATGATSYRLDVSTSNTFATMLAGYNDLTVNTLSQAVNGLNANTPYYYRVRAYNTIGTSASSNTINTTTLANDPFSGYYTSVSGLSGSSLKSGLHTLLRTTHTTEFSYSNLETQMKVTDEDPLNSNNVIELYTGWSVPKSSYGGGVTNWNKEHTWSKSHGDFGETAPAGTDLHHLRPCDATVNSAKSNRFFDYGSSAYTDASPPSGYTGVTGCLTATDIWEPRDADKGDVARMIFYMAVRYEGDDTSYDLELVDSVPSSSSVLPIYGKLSTLLEWNASDPPDAWEALRNSRIQSLQGNRNPFVDHPEYVTSIWGGTALTTTVTFTTTGATVNEADGSITLSVQIQNPSATTATTAQIAITSGSNSDVGNFTTRSITFPANSSANQTTSVTITNDSILEGTETIVFSLINVSGGNSAAVGNYGSFNLEIEDNDIPTPVATAATALSYSGFTANWNAAAGITDYQFDLSTTSAFTSFVGVYENYPVSATTLLINGLNAGTSYYYRVRAVYNESIGISSGTITATTSTIAAPVATAATNLGFTGFTANWNAVPGFTDYQLDLSISPTFGSYVGVYQNYAVSSTSLVITGLSGGTTYYYRIKTMLGLNYSEYSNSITTITNSITYLDAPVATEATAISHEGFTARWDAVAGADGYRLDVFSGSGGTTTDLIISEYVEGSSNNKYIEIFNGTGTDVDLSTYKIKLYSNGSITAGNTQTLSGTLPNNTCLVFKNSSATLTLPEGVTATTSATTNFNGNDAIAIVKGDPEVYVDIFGNIGDATYWASAPLSATNQTLRRKSTVLSGVTVDLDNDAGFPTLATEWESFAIDTVSGLGTHSIGASSPVSGYQDLAVSSNIARVSGLDPETEYSYRVRAENIGDTSDNSNTIMVTTTASTAGTGANTTIGGAATTVLLPVISSYSNNNVVLDPATSSNDDFAVSVSTISGGIRYSFVTTNNSAFNGSYTLNHNGLGYAPGTLLYRLGGETFSSSNYSSTATQTSVTISGLSRNRGTFEIDLLQATQSLGVPIVTISVAGNTITLDWDAIDGATSYRIEAADSPEGTFSSLGTTANLTYSHSSLTRKFYKVYALN